MDGLKTVDKIKWTENTVLGRKQCKDRTMILNTLQRKLKKFLQDCEIEVLEWPPQSADLNPIENLWSLLDGEIPLGKRYNKTVFLNDL